MNPVKVFSDQANGIKPCQASVQKEHSTSKLIKTVAKGLGTGFLNGSEVFGASMLGLAGLEFLYSYPLPARIVPIISIGLAGGLISSIKKIYSLHINKPIKPTGKFTSNVFPPSLANRITQAVTTGMRGSATTAGIVFEVLISYQLFTGRRAASLISPELWFILPAVAGISSMAAKFFSKHSVKSISPSPSNQNPSVMPSNDLPRSTRIYNLARKATQSLAAGIYDGSATFGFGAFGVKLINPRFFYWQTYVNATLIAAIGTGMYAAYQRFQGNTPTPAHSNSKFIEFGKVMGFLVKDTAANVTIGATAWGILSGIFKISRHPDLIDLLALSAALSTATNIYSRSDRFWPSWKNVSHVRKAIGISVIALGVFALLSRPTQTLKAATLVKNTSLEAATLVKNTSYDAFIYTQNAALAAFQDAAYSLTSNTITKTRGEWIDGYTLEEELQRLGSLQLTAPCEQVLNICGKNLAIDEVKKTAKRKYLQIHPDKNPENRALSEAATQVLNAAVKKIKETNKCSKAKGYCSVVNKPLTITTTLHTPRWLYKLMTGAEPQCTVTAENQTIKAPLNRCDALA